MVVTDLADRTTLHDVCFALGWNGVFSEVRIAEKGIARRGHAGWPSPLTSPRKALVARDRDLLCPMYLMYQIVVGIRYRLLCVA